ncbi:hypothetical protein CBR_g50828 [Chara braunii]|uniref:Uncharacterized protein n=1 Tax=Chara braunii TaxID=69332 RepID=A0A388M7Q2_CHABU|nr:hypothetical protein CBR_g50828 [Chara braunii]|eukprot:GBG90482.1 hypothetical protein CBR_g50828 [Chara braunii]
MENNPVIGIDLGTSYCCVAVFFDTERIQIVPNDVGSKITPSYVAFSEKDGCLVGGAAKKHGLEYPEQCVFEVKRLMGRSFSDPTLHLEAKRMPFMLSSGPLGDVVVDISEKKFRPEDISAFLLKEMKRMAEDYANFRPIRDAVLTVPARFNYRQRKATMAAAAQAGLNVLRLMSEPTAAALAYGHESMRGSGRQERKVLVFDMGGESLNVSVVGVKVGSQNDFSFVVKTGIRESQLGGAEIDERLFYRVEGQLRRHPQGKDVGFKPLVALKPRIRAKLNQLVVQAKHDLSVKTETQIDLDCGGEDILSLRLSRVDFEKRNQELFLKCVLIVMRALRDAKIGKGEISEVLLAGGSTRIPAVQKNLTAFFGKPPLKSFNPDEAVAFGAAVMAGQLARRDKCKQAPTISVRHHDDIVTSVSIGVDTKFGIMRVVIPRNSLLPANGTAEYGLPDGEGEARVKLYEGESALCANNLPLGELALDGFTLRLDIKDVVVRSSDAAGETDWYTAEAKAEDVRIWEARESMNAVWMLIGKLRDQLSCRECHGDLEKHVNETMAWYMGLEELPSKRECDKRYEELESLAKVHSLDVV